jgi:hypothetical protein
MFTLMKSEQTKISQGPPGPRAYKQRRVAEYAKFADAIAACNDANREFKARHYVLNESGKELYADTWID